MTYLHSTFSHIGHAYASVLTPSSKCRRVRLLAHRSSAAARAAFTASVANSKRYRECVRTLATNLRRNDALAARVRRGEADIEALVRADATELATEAVTALLIQ